MLSELRRLNHKYSNFVYGRTCLLKSNLDKFCLDRRKQGSYGFRVRNNTVETSLFRFEDLCVFSVIIAAIPVSINIR